MNTSLTCDENSRRMNAEQYAARSMAVEDAEAFEDHFVTCAACQDEVRFASAIVSGLPNAHVGTPLPARSRRAWLWGVGGVALAAGLATLMIFPPVSSRREFVALGDVREPPVYLGIPVRGAGAQPDSLFEAAMDSYAKRHYSAAVEGLRAALAAGKDAVPAQFFLAASLLLDNQAREAIDAFERVIRKGETPYRAEARYYRAKALLRMGRAADAQAELAPLTRADGVVYDMGRALADSVARERVR